MTILGRPYVGRKATDYDAKRVVQRKWHRENEIIEGYLDTLPRAVAVLDVPVGTGRFGKAYHDRGLPAWGVDASPAMLDLARDQAFTHLEIGDATKLAFDDNAFHTVVCVRLFHLMPDYVMKKALREVCRVARSCVILTIQLGETYNEGLEVATHDKKRFYNLVAKHGFTIVDDQRITSAGWHVMKCVRS